LTTGCITFGSLNNFSKVTEAALHAWREVLDALPGSRFILHAKQGSHRQRVQSIFASAGIDPSRVEFVGHLPASDYYALYQRIDIALDTFPFAGGTTTCDALWMGAPVISLAGDTPVSRGGLSALSNVGLPELVARSTGEYARLAIELANDLPRLAQLRASLRGRMRSSPLMDEVGCVADLEAVYRTMWLAWCARS
jgi:predicted O-linked N-acetylglucosamine transferase (SPINDLY family)